VSAGGLDPVPSLDLLVFGPHPDDIEIGLGGTVARHAARGDRVGLCDLTRGELGTNGTPEERVREAEEARAVLGAIWRGNLCWPDGGIDGTAGQIRAAAELIRRARPRVVAIPYWRDRHPDHVAASRVLTDAVFKSRLRRYAADGEAWEGEWVCYYFINDASRASFLVDVSEHYDVKRRALACHRSQFQPSGAGARRTRLSSPRFLQLVESRDAQFGAQAGVAFAEGIVVREPLLREHVFKS
jgi:bacillithiol biosynthesis deacetylase BshB1